MSFAYIICANEEDIRRLKSVVENNLNIEVTINSGINSIIEKRVIRILHNLGVSNSLKGYKLLKDTIMYYLRNQYINNFNKDLYPVIAKENNISVNTLDKSISRVIEKSINNADYDYLEKLFGSSIDINKGKPTNKEYIMTVVEAININIDFKM